MARQQIPERNPIGDDFTGRLIQVDDSYLLVTESIEIEDATLIHNGALTVRYGVRFLGKPHLSIVPAILALDYGDMLTGEEAWDFLLNKSNLYPRSEVVGHRNDGTDDMIQIKWLDLMDDLEILVYADNQATTPLASVTALIAPDSHEIPSRLNDYLPRYTSITNWKANKETHDKP